MARKCRFQGDPYPYLQFLYFFLRVSSLFYPILTFFEIQFEKVYVRSYYCWTLKFLQAELTIRFWNLILSFISSFESMHFLNHLILMSFADAICVITFYFLLSSFHLQSSAHLYWGGCKRRHTNRFMVVSERELTSSWKEWSLGDR